MATPILRGIGPVLLFSLVGIGVVPRSALAQPPRVQLHLDARGGLEAATLALAQQTASSLIAASAIDIAWRDCGDEKSCGESVYTTVRVQLLPSMKTTDAEVCGETVRDGRSGGAAVLVYVPRLVALTQSMRSGRAGRSNPSLATLEPGHLIGLTVAHEVGHALGLPHARSGVMKARPSVEDVIDLRQSQLGFRPSEAATMRAALAAHEERIADATLDANGGVEVQRRMMAPSEREETAASPPNLSVPDILAPLVTRM